MITTATILAFLKSQASFAALAAAVLNFVNAERVRQYELTRELGTLACEIENCRIVGKDSSTLQKRYEQLEKFLKA